MLRLAQCVELYRRAITQTRLAGLARPGIINLRRKFYGTSVRIDVDETRRNGVAHRRRHKRARTCESRARCRDDESYLRHAGLRQVSRRVKRARVKYDGVSRRIIFFPSPFLHPHNLISATHRRNVARREAPFRLSLSAENFTNSCIVTTPCGSLCAFFFLYKISLTQHYSLFSTLRVAELALSQFF